MHLQEEEGGVEDQNYEDYEDEYQEEQDLERQYSYHQAPDNMPEDLETYLPVDAWESLFTIADQDRDEVIARAPARLKNSSPLEWVTVYQLKNPSNLASFKCLYDKGSTRSLLDSTVANKIGKNIRLLQNPFWLRSHGNLC